MITDTDLTPCPFCGHVPHAKDHIRIEGDAVEYAVNCRACGACGPRRLTLDAAATAWDIRTSAVPEPAAAR